MDSYIECIEFNLSWNNSVLFATVILEWNWMELQHKKKKSFKKKKKKERFFPVVGEMLPGKHLSSRQAMGR